MPLGCPRLRWENNLAKDLKGMNIEEPLDAMMTDRQEWKSFVKSAKTHPESSSSRHDDLRLKPPIVMGGCRMDLMRLKCWLTTPPP